MKVSHHAQPACDEEGHIKERCPVRLKDFLKQRGEQRNRKPGCNATLTALRANRVASPARRKQVKFVEAQQTLPVVAKSYGHRHVVALESDGDAPDGQECSDLLDGVDLATLDEATVAALYEELQEPEEDEEEVDFHDGQ